jgi:LacI family transcriptional regulator
MRATLGRSPKAEILRVKLARLRQLLLETNLPLDAIARRCGFAHARYVNQLFRKQYGQSPGAFRAAQG